MAYTTIKKPSDYFNTVTWTGTNDATTSVTGVNFKPDLVWIKNRNVADDPLIHDGVRGVTKQLFTSSTGAEQTNSEGIQSFDADGFTTGTHRSTGGDSGNGMVSWNWLGANGTTSNTDGSITSTVSANTTSGFSIVSYTGTGSNATVGHGLGSLPGMVIVKGRNTTSTNHWFVFHQNSQSSYSASGSAILLLNASNAVDNIGVGGVWNNTSPTSSVFNIGTENGVNESGKDFIAYCFAEKQGYSKFGSYIGNGVNGDGTFVYTGFKPSFILVKNADEIKNWYIYDTTRDTVQPLDLYLIANLSNTEASFSAYNTIDALSNGFKLRGGSSGNGSETNSSGRKYIYMAFAEEPLVGDNPATAR